MSIVSKFDRTKESYEASVELLRVAITTPRAASQTRAELAEAREFACSSGMCYYCREPIEVGGQSPRHTEACKKCGKLIDGMMQLTSKITSGSGSIDNVKALHKAYVTCDFVTRLPGALRGATGDVVDIIKAFEPVLEAYEMYNVERKARVAREAEQYLEKKRRADILAMLVQCGADPDADETKQRVDEIYWDRYADEHL